MDVRRGDSSPHAVRHARHAENSTRGLLVGPGLNCAPSRIRTCAHGSGDRLAASLITHSDLRKRLGTPSVCACSIASLSRLLVRDIAPERFAGQHRCG